MSDFPFSIATTQEPSTFMGFRCKMTSGARTYAQGSTFYYDTTVFDTENGVTQTPSDPSTKYTIPKTGYWSFYAQLASYNVSILLEVAVALSRMLNVVVWRIVRLAILY